MSGRPRAEGPLPRAAHPPFPLAVLHRARAGGAAHTAAAGPRRRRRAAPAPGLDPLPGPASTDRVLQPLPEVKARSVRLTASARHSILRLAFGSRVATFAKHLVGVRYSYGGTSPRTGFDCSGLVRYVYGHFGISLAHSSFAQFLNGSRVARASLKPGDLVFFDDRGHVGIYIGNGRFIHAPHTGTRVRIETLEGWYGARYDGARRVRRA